MGDQCAKYAQGAQAAKSLEPLVKGCAHPDFGHLHTGARGAHQDELYSLWLTELKGPIRILPMTNWTREDLVKMARGASPCVKAALAAQVAYVDAGGPGDPNARDAHRALVAARKAIPDTDWPVFSALTGMATEALRPLVCGQ